MVTQAIPAKIQPPPRELEWISTAQFAADCVKLAGLLPADTSRVVGIPRSGMIAAAIVATHLHLPLWELTGGHFRQIALGSRGAWNRSGRTIVIDDTVFGGHAMRRARHAIREEVQYAAVYVRPDHTSDVQYFARSLHHRSHLLEWNFFNNHAIQLAGVGYDFDGVLCRDPTVSDNDEAGYRRWLAVAVPLHLPRAQPVRLIATARLERYRPETEAWLARWGVRCERLVMNQADSPGGRGDVAALKAAAYASSITAYFLESDPRQAERIHKLTGKQVICPVISKVWAAR